ncbi:TetR/AcrR family transcriptional regulator [Adhaeribacter rhizoryzae]|uniref:TetR/AcrR family transcriptional regulator n=1 Tax=Adhaeribacter rhizoryzae TaxID=2607907 RepID=A0A5M6D4K3_9BACT|nr:TetR/AcrR family transcriptional regulator [Adhaeribacter rhizoryzae]KAA5542434.1 TetR/AcrR family transcriptional regulator [Adhaeribacter rhizoryzae]
MAATESQNKAKLTRKEQIESIATALFKQRGFAATSMRDLASAVGIEAASIYAHVRSKEEILQSICFKMANEFFAELAEIESQSITYTQKLRQVITAHIKIITHNIAASTVFQQEWRHLSEPFLTDFLSLREKYEHRIRELIQQGIETGEFISSDTRFVTRTLLSSLNGITQWYKLDGELSPEAIAGNLADLFLNGLNTHKDDRPKYH